MAKKSYNDSKYAMTFNDLKKSFKKEIPKNILLFLNEKILFDEILDILANKFFDNKFDPKASLKTHYSDESDIEEVIGDCSNISFFSEKKIVIYKIVKKTGIRGISKEAKEAFLSYVKNPNPDTLLILLIPDKEFTFSNFDDFEGTNMKIFIIKENKEAEIKLWIKEKLSDYKIDDSVIMRLFQFVNLSYDEINSELEKLKTFCYDSKEITLKDVNLCVGISKDFDENNLFEAIIKRDFASAIGIYENMSSKQTASSIEVELKFLGYMTNLFIALHKLCDHQISKMPDGTSLFKIINLWKDPYRMIKLYKEYIKDFNELKIKNAFDYIYKTDKSLKSTQQDKHILINNLIHNLTNL